MAQFDKKEFQKRLQRIEELVRTIESVDNPKVRASAVELMRSLMELHGAAIERMMEIVFENDSAGAEIIDRFADDDLTASLLLLYNLHPLDLNSRVMQALDNTRAYLRSHGGDVELLGINDGVVRLRLYGSSSNGCGSSAISLKSAVEEAIYESAPDIAGLEIEGAGAAPVASGLVQLKRSRAKNTDAHQKAISSEVNSGIT